MGKLGACHNFLFNLLAVTSMITIMPCSCLGPVLIRRRGVDIESEGDMSNNFASNHNDTIFRNSIPGRVSSGDFPICTDLTGPFAPFCLPEDGVNMFIDTTYYVTWDADFYPLNSTITIELIYSGSPEGTSAFTSERTDNSYGYIPLHMRSEWLQGKPNNSLTFYIIELEPTSDQRASARQGPTIQLRPKPVEHYKPSSPAPFNKLALCIGLPASLAVVIIIVAGQFLGMRSSRRIGYGNIMGSRDRGYGIRKSKAQRLGNDRKHISDMDGLSALRNHTSDAESSLVEAGGSEFYPDLEHATTRMPKREGPMLKSWKF